MTFRCLSEPTEAIPFKEFPALVKEHFHLSEDKPEQLAFFDQDMRTQSYLVRDDPGNYRFAHKSMMEYFVAHKPAVSLARGEMRRCVLTDAIVSFLHYVLAPVCRYEVREENGMVWVPPGPFVFGFERMGNLTIANIEQGCEPGEGYVWMRGGSWGYSRGYAECASRDIAHPSYRSSFIGFRCART